MKRTLVAAGITLAFLVSCNAMTTKKPAEQNAATQQAAPEVKTIYKCPMHPEITSDQPGKCSKCGMDLRKF